MGKKSALSRTIIIKFSLTRNKALAAMIVALLCVMSADLGSETLTLTTYYPAPYGVYASMVTTGNTYLARDLGGKVGIGTTTPGEKLDVAGNVRVSNSINIGGNVSAAGNVLAAGKSVLTGVSCEGVTCWVTGNILNIKVSYSEDGTP